MTAAAPVGSGIPAPSRRARDLHDLMVAFMRDRVLPAEHGYEAYRASAGPDDHTVPPVVEELKREARAVGLWNLFLPAESGLTQLEYAPLAELSGWSSDTAPEAINCQVHLRSLGRTELRREPVLLPSSRAGRGGSS